jgi:hypothetical protein
VKRISQLPGFQQVQLLSGRHFQSSKDRPSRPSRPLRGWQWQWVLCCVLLSLGPGCGDPSSVGRPDGQELGGQASDGEQPGQNSRQLSAEEILKQSVVRYARARSYRDQGVLHLNYRLLGKPIKEPHPFSVIWQADNRLASRIFKGQLSSDGELLSCYVYDIQSGNLDGQQLFLPVAEKLPLDQLYQDSIVRHYLGGYADLPLDETEKDLPPKLIPPTLSLLLGQHSFGWIQSPQLVERLPDQRLETFDCYVIRSMYREMTADIWIDRDTNLLVQIAMPLKIMDRQVVTSPEISEVELTLRFHQAEIDQDLRDEDRRQFAVGLKKQGLPVRRFVKIPDPFPSEKIGQLSPRFNLISSSGGKVDQLHFDGRPTVLLWLSGLEESRVQQTILPSLKRLVEGYPPETLSLGLVYSETELGDGGGRQLERSWEAILQPTGWSLFYDSRLQVAEKFELKVMPAAVIMDRNSRIEFVGSLSDENCMVDLQAALQRIVRGDSIAEEMKRDYQKFVAGYHQQLESVTARPLLGMADPTGPAAESPVPLPGTGVATLAPRLIWKNQNLRQPGNLIVDEWVSPPRIYVLDGWRTVVQLDPEGNELARHSLELPPGAAVSCLRIARQPEANRSERVPQFAAFSVQGERVYLFDRNWQGLDPLPMADFVHQGIRDVQFFPTDDGLNPRQNVIVSFSQGLGSYRFDLQQKTINLIARQSADSLTVYQDRLWFATPDGYGALQDEETVHRSSPGGQFQRIGSSRSLYRPQSGMLTLTQADRENNWSLARINPAGEIVWSQPIGSQLFNHEIEPLASCQPSEGQLIWGVADAQNRVTLISGAGQYLGQLNPNQQIAGLAMYAYNGNPYLIVALEQELACYRLGSSSVPAIQVSNQPE